MDEKMNSTSFEEEEKEEKKEELIDSGESNSIYLYLKANPSLLIAILTFVSTIALGLATFLLYLVQASYLNYWGVSDLYVNVTDKTQLFNILVVVLAFLLVLFITSYSSYRFSAFDQLMKVDCYYLKTCNGIIVNAKQFKDDTDTIHKAKELACKIRKNIAYLLLRSFVQSIPSVLFVSIFISMLFYSYENYHAFKIAFTFLLSIYSSQLFVFFLKLFQFRREVRKDDYEYEDPSLEEIENKYFVRKPLPELLTNKRIKSIANYVLIYMFCIFILMSILGNYNAEHKTKFPIINDEDTLYVEVYKSKDYVVLERAKINNNSLTVFCNDQRIVGVEDYQFSIRTFDKVIKKE